MIASIKRYMAKFLFFHPITLTWTGTMDSEESVRENIPDDYIEVSDEAFLIFQKNPNWIWDGTKPVPPDQAPPLTIKQIEAITDTKRKSDKLKKQVEEIYIEYGKFIVMFEHMVEVLRKCIFEYLAFNHRLNEQHAHVLIKNYNVPQYIENIEALFNLIFPDEIESQKLVKKLLNKVTELNNKRVKVVHGLHFIGFANDTMTDFSEVRTLLRTKKSNNFRQSVKIFSAKELKILFKEAAKLHGLLGRLAYCMMQPTPGITERNITHEMIDHGTGFRSMYHPLAPIWDISMYDKLLSELPRKPED